MGNRGKIGAKRLGANKSTTFDEWMAGENASKWATREQVVAYSQFQFREQTVPFMADFFKNAIARYQQIQRDKVWYRRLGRWIKGLIVKQPMDVNNPEVRAALRKELDALDGEKQEPTLGPDNPGETAPAESDEPISTTPTSCVVCGSRNLGPVNEIGGVKCSNGHILQGPPEPIGLVVDRDPAPSPTIEQQ